MQRLIGNSVPPPLAKMLGDELWKVLPYKSEVKDDEDGLNFGRDGRGVSGREKRGGLAELHARFRRLRLAPHKVGIMKWSRKRALFSKN